MIDKDGYRSNVGIVLLNHNNQIFWGRRKGESAWQFPQGGIGNDEQTEDAMFRELNEELGLFPEHVEIVGRTREWLYYDVPAIYNRNKRGSYRGQKQIWFLLRFVGKDHHINLKYHKHHEFDAWFWMNDYWAPVDQVVNFKQDVYRKALTELHQYIKV